MTTLEILKAARAKIESPERWTRGCLARDEFGDEVPPNLSVARKWCLVGACDDIRALEILEDVLEEEGEEPPAAFNDDPRTTHDDILALFDRAIASEDA